MKSATAATQRSRTTITMPSSSGRTTVPDVRTRPRPIEEIFSVKINFVSLRRVSTYCLHCVCRIVKRFSKSLPCLLQTIVKAGKLCKNALQRRKMYVLMQRFPTFLCLRHPYLILKIFGGTPTGLIGI